MTALNSPGVHVLVRDGRLFLNLTDAITPVIWQFDLSSAQSAVMDVTPMEKGFAIRLGMVDGQVHQIAMYAERARAVSVLTLIHQALTGGEENIKTKETPHTWLAAVAFILFVVVILFLSSLFSGPSRSGQTTAQINSATPQSAEDFLRGRAP